MLSRIGSWERQIEQKCRELCFVDGHDVGSGTANIVLYADDNKVDLEVSSEDLIQEGKLPEKVRIGIAEYSNEDRTDWHYRPVFPPDLHDFDLTYPEDSRGL